MAQQSIEEINNIFQRNLLGLLQDYSIQLVYVFGSYAKGNNNKNSDLDIAMLMEEVDFNDKLSLIGDLTDIFKRNDIDLVILNSANSVLKHQIIKYGKLIYMKSEDIKVKFEVKVLKEYMDMEPFRRTQMKYINQWIENIAGGEEND